MAESMLSSSHGALLSSLALFYCARFFKDAARIEDGRRIDGDGRAKQYRRRDFSNVMQCVAPDLVRPNSDRMRYAKSITQ